MKKDEISKAMKLIGSRGGKATAKKYTTEQLAEWGRKGGLRAGQNKKANKDKV